MRSHWFHDARIDLRLAARSVVKQPFFALTAALVLAVGIGATSTIFSLANAFLIRPLPVRDGASLVMLSAARGDGRWHALSYPDYLDYQQQADVFEQMAGYALKRVGLSTEAWADPIVVSYVSGNFFAVLGVPPALGRVFRPGEGRRAGADPILMLGYDYWQRRFGGDPTVLGRILRINGEGFTIVGVASEKFRGPYAAAVMDAYLPIGMLDHKTDPPTSESRDTYVFRVLGRIEPGVTLEEAQSSLDVIAGRLAAQYPETNRDVRIRVKPETLVRPDPENADDMPAIVAVFMALVGLLLLMACFNVANMLTLQVLAKERQLAIRAALGANRFRLIRQLLAESFLLALLGGIFGCVLAVVATRFLSALSIPDIPASFDFSLDWRVYTFIGAASAGAGLIAGLVPSWRASRAHLQHALSEGARGATSGAPRQRLRAVLVGIQIAGCLALLVTSGLFVRSFLASQAIDIGFDREQLIVLYLDPSQYGYNEPEGKTLYRELLRRTRSLAGVESAAHASSVPLGYRSRATQIVAEGHVLGPDERGLRAGYNVVSSDYFETMKIPLLRGRLFTTADSEDSRPVAVINETMADELWPGEDVLGRRFRRIEDDADTEIDIEVVGVVPNGKYFVFWEEPTAFFYRPFVQSYTPIQTLHVRAALDPTRLSASLRDSIHELAPNVPVLGLMTMEESLKGGNGFLLVTLGAYVASTLGLLAILLATVGLYSVVSFAAGTRTQEIGIRMAVGACRRDILRLVLRQGVHLTLVGIAFGLVATVGLSRFLTSLLVGTRATDPLTYVRMSLLLLLVALAASLAPARRASRVDPLVSLRHD